MPNAIHALRGMKDNVPSETGLWQSLEGILKKVLHRFGYQEIRFPLLEKTELFCRTIGHDTDIVNKEMYTFLDRHGESVTLRPEGTASCVRAVIEQGLLKKIQRLWYLGPFFRYERPQKGRLRQFHQCGAEAFGFAGPDIDAEMIALTANIFETLQLSPFVSLQLNSLGTKTARLAYRTALQDYFLNHQALLDEETRVRLQRNPLRVLDSKSPHLKELLVNAPQLFDYLDEPSLTYFHTLQAYLKALNIPFSINPHLVRGLDYYTHTVFEWVSEHLGAQSAVCSGGRYDGLVHELGGEETKAIGFALGMERLLLLMQQKALQNNRSVFDQHVLTPHVYFMTENEVTFMHALSITKILRAQLPLLRLILHCGGGHFAQQFKKADQSGARYALILGEEEWHQRVIAVKPLRETGIQQTVAENDLSDYLQGIIANEQ